MIKGKNFSGNVNPPKAERYENCNFTQPSPNTAIFVGDATVREFFECNLVNCVPPVGSKLTKCNTTQVERMVEVGTEDVLIDGKVSKIKRYVDQIQGRLNAKTLKLEAKARDVQVDQPKGSKDAIIKQLAKERDRAERERVAKEVELKAAVSISEVER